MTYAQIIETRRRKIRRLALTIEAQGLLRLAAWMDPHGKRQLFAAAAFEGLISESEGELLIQEVERAPS